MTFREFVTNIVIPVISNEDVAFVQEAIEKLNARNADEDAD